jgi:pyridoxine 5-phosphate synthase
MGSRISQRKKKKFVALGVNIDHVATLRQARGGDVPDLLRAARISERAGADGITVHLREDRRHIQDLDVKGLRKMVGTKLNLEMSVAREIVDIACRIKPDQATLVPERRQELTTEGGLDVVGQITRIARVVKRLKSQGIIPSLFIDPDPKQIRSASRTGAEAIELHTGRYANTFHKASSRRKELEALKDAAHLAESLGLEIYAGHGLDYENVQAVAKIKSIVELNIGHSIISHAVFVGLECAVREMKKKINFPSK